MENKLSLEEANNRVCEMEERYDLLQYKIDGWCAWPIIRIPLIVNLRNIRRSKPAILSNSAKHVLTFRDIQQIPKFQKVCYVVKTASSGLVEQENDRYKDVWFDDLVRELDDVFKFEEVNNLNFVSRRKDALIPSNMTTAPFELLSAHFAKHLKRPTYIADIANCFNDCIQTEFGLGSFTHRSITYQLKRFYWYKKLYGWLLQHLSMEYLLISSQLYALMAAAKEQRSKVVEFQHGVVYRYHPTYSWTSYATPYKKHMPIPDAIFLYGEHWKQELETTGFWGDTLQVVGSLRIDQYRQRKAARKDKAIQDTPLCIMLLTLQGRETQKIAYFMHDFLEMAKSLPMYVKLHIKLHPVFGTEKQPVIDAFQTDEHVTILGSHENPSTFELLTQAHVHLSISSTCHYEALALGVPTIILPFEGHESVLHLHTKGHAFLVHTPKDILDIIMSTQNYNVPDEVSEYYFKSNALYNMKFALAKNNVRGNLI